MVNVQSPFSKFIFHVFKMRSPGEPYKLPIPQPYTFPPSLDNRVIAGCNLMELPVLKALQRLLHLQTPSKFLPLKINKPPHNL